MKLSTRFETSRKTLFLCWLLKLSCDSRFQRAFTACACVFKIQFDTWTFGTLLFPIEVQLKQTTGKFGLSDVIGVLLVDGDDVNLLDLQRLRSGLGQGEQDSIFNLEFFSIFEKNVCKSFKNDFKYSKFFITLSQNMLSNLCLCLKQCFNH